MAKLSILAGTTSKLLRIFVQNSSVTTGAGLTGLAFNTASLTGYYIREGAGSTTQITLATQTLGTWATGGFIVVDATNMPGMYEIGIPNAAIASGAKSVVIYFQGAANMAPVVLEVELTAVDNQNSVNYGLTGVPNAAAGASGGLLISGSNSGTTTFGALTCTGSFTVSDGLLISRSTSNSSAITATGNGTGNGAVLTSGSGATGDGLQTTSVSTNGNGFVSTGIGTGNGLRAVSVSGDAITTSVATSGHGVSFVGTGSAKNGIQATGGTSGTGIAATGNGVGSGIVATSGSGASGDGIQATCVSTNGNGFALVGKGTGSGFTATAGATGTGMLLTGGASSGVGLKATGGGAGGGVLFTGVGGSATPGLQCTGGSAGGSPAGPGILATGGTASTSAGGTSGIGLSIVGGSGAATTNGAGVGLNVVAGAITTVSGNDAFKATGSGNGNGFTIVGAGTGNGAMFNSGAGATGDAVRMIAQSTNGDGLQLTGAGTGFDLNATTTNGLEIGSISGVTFPTNFGSTAISAGGAVTIDGTSQLTEAYPTKGSAFTLAQALYNLVQELGERAITSTTVTILKRDQSTTAKTYTLNSATTPTSSTEAT